MTPDDAYEAAPLSTGARPESRRAGGEIPRYLTDHYRWAYIDAGAISFFDQGWVVNLILWGQFRRLSERAFAALGPAPLRGRTLQVACVYGDLSPRLARRLDVDGRLDIIDVLPQQLRNAARKLAAGANVELRLENSADLATVDGSYDRALVFFLLHEMPEAVRRATLREAVRVVRPGGRIVIVDYHQPRRFNPLRYVMRGVLARLEPFALDLWRQPLSEWLPANRCRILSHDIVFGGLYQVLVLEAAG